MAKTDGGNKIPEGAISKAGGVEYIYENGEWRPTKTDGWKPPLRDVQKLNSNVSKGDYKVWNQKLEKYEKGQPVPLSPKAGANTLVKYVADIAVKNETLKRKITAEPISTEDELAAKKDVVTGKATQKEKEAVIEKTPAVTETLKTKGLADFLPETAKALASTAKIDNGQPLKESSLNLDTSKYPLGEAKTGMNLGSLAAYLPDAFKFGLGLLSANEQLPQYEIPQEFMDYKQQMQSLSEQGLTADELAKAKTDAERGYTYDVNAIKNFAGGKAGVALGNLGRATTSLQDAYKNINVADAAMQRSNMAAYGGVLSQYLNLDRMKFGDQYQEAMMNKQSGAQLAADALSNIQGRADYEKTYGKGSIYEKYMQSQTEGLDLQNELLQYQIDNPIDYSNMNFSPQAIPMGNFPQFMQYLMAGGQGK